MHGKGVKSLQNVSRKICHGMNRHRLDLPPQSSSFTVGQTGDQAYELKFATRVCLICSMAIKSR